MSNTLTLYVSNIPDWTSEEEFSKHFLQLDGCVACRLIRDKNNKQVGFVDFTKSFERGTQTVIICSPAEAPNK